MHHLVKHTVPRKYHRKFVHRNSRNILSIIFDEMNCSDESFFKLKKSLETAHKDYIHFTAKQSYDIFTRES